MRGSQAGMGEITAKKGRAYEQARKTGKSIEDAMAAARAA